MRLGEQIHKSGREAKKINKLIKASVKKMGIKNYVAVLNFLEEIKTVLDEIENKSLSNDED